MNRSSLSTGSRVGLALVAIAAFTAPLAAAKRERLTGPAALGLVHVSTTQLARTGVVLKPTAAHAAVAAQAADLVASRNMGSSRALETVLVQCRTTQSYPLMDKPCYVVALDPSGHETSGPIGAPSQKMTYSFALVDAATGEFIRGFEGTGD